jgi:hypothetical protein
MPEQTVFENRIEIIRRANRAAKLINCAANSRNIVRGQRWFGILRLQRAGQQHQHADLARRYMGLDIAERRIEQIRIYHIIQRLDCVQGYRLVFAIDVWRAIDLIGAALERNPQ